MTTISFVEKIPKEIEEKMGQGINEYAASHGIKIDWKPFALMLLNETKEACINLPYQFSKEAYAQTIPFFHNIFVWNSDFQTNNVFIPSGH